jgi:3'-phosphoadenosine 5'-phosphosulfate sulfotransferase (PAPS reductase)/FAD synthetase
MAMTAEVRYVSWFSCGAASAVATKLQLSRGPTTIAYCEVVEEHPDNKRFLADCEEWFGQKIEVLGNDKYSRSIYEVFAKTKYLSGPAGARCTGELKKEVRKKFSKDGDVNVFGYTVEEQDRLDRFIDANNSVDVVAPLIDAGLTKGDCLAMIKNAGIEVPEMYKLGYKNNNCMGCVKASSPAYWKKIQADFPDMFEKMNSYEKRLGRSVCKIDMKTVRKKYPDHYDDGAQYWRPQLHELPGDIIAMDNTLDAQCGIFCHIAEDEYNRGQP